MNAFKKFYFKFSFVISNFKITIKNYLINNRPGISLLLVKIFFMSTLLTFLIEELHQTILLYPQDIKNIWTWYKLLTYPFYVNGLLNWLYDGIAIIIAGYIIEHRVSKRKVIALIVLSSIIGGLIYSIINVNDPLNSPIGSPTMIAWGLLSCAFILIIKKIRSSILFEKIVAGLFIVSLLSIEVIDYGLLAGQIAVIIFGILYGLIFDEKKTTTNISLKELRSAS